MSSYLFMMFILLFGGSILITATLDFIGLGPVEHDLARDDDAALVQNARCSCTCGGGSCHQGSRSWPSSARSTS